MAKSIVACAAALIALSFVGPGQPPEPSPSARLSLRASPPASSRRAPPVRLYAAGPESVLPGSAVVVTLRVARTAQGSAFSRLLVHVPEGAELISGQAAEALADTAAPELLRVYTLRLLAVPAGDLRFELLEGAGTSVLRAEAAYRFGRAAPRLMAPWAPPIRLKGGLVLNPVQGG